MNGWNLNWNWKWGVALGVLVALLLYLDHNPGVLKGIFKWTQTKEGHPRTEKVSRAEFSGKLAKALLYASEVNQRLVSYKSQFDCPDGVLLDNFYFDGGGANSRQRSTWWELRRELPELVSKHEALISALHEAQAAVTRGDSIETWQDLPDEAQQASAALDETIKQNNRKTAAFAVIATQLKAAIAAQERRNKQ